MIFFIILHGVPSMNRLNQTHKGEGDRRPGPAGLARQDKNNRRSLPNKTLITGCGKQKMM
jgi:hypothetical protein